MEQSSFQRRDVIFNSIFRRLPRQSGKASNPAFRPSQMTEQLERRILLSQSPAARLPLESSPGSVYPAPAAQTVAALLPALAASPIVRSTLPPALLSDGPARGLVKLDIAVQLSQVVEGKAAFAVYTSSSETVDGSSVLLGKAIRQVHLSTGGHVTVAVPLPRRPRHPQGFYNLVAAVTDPAGSTAFTTLDRTVNVAAPFVSLRENIEKTSLPASHGTVDMEVTNFGNTTTSKTTTCALYATDSPKGTGAKSAHHAPSIDRPLRIKPGKTARVTIPYHSIPTLSPGTHGAVVQLTNGDDVPIYVAITTDG